MWPAAPDNHAQPSSGLSWGSSARRAEPQEEAAADHNHRTGVSARTNRDLAVRRSLFTLQRRYDQLVRMIGLSASVLHHDITSSTAGMMSFHEPRAFPAGAEGHESRS